MEIAAIMVCFVFLHDLIIRFYFSSCKLKSVELIFQNSVHIASSRTILEHPNSTKFQLNDDRSLVEKSVL